MREKEFRGISRKLSFKKRRSVSFVKRKKTVEKMAKELSILCGIDVLLIGFESPSSQPPSFSWPEDHPSCLSLIQKYMSLSEDERKKRAVESSGFLKEKVENLQSELLKKKPEIQEIEMGHLLHSLSGYFIPEGLGLNELQDVVYRLDWKMAAVNKRIRSLVMPRESMKERIRDRVENPTKVKGFGAFDWSGLNHQHSFGFGFFSGGDPFSVYY